VPDTLKVVVADDEKIARARLVRLIEETGLAEVVAACAGGREAVDRTIELQPDLLFLDVQMPDLDGFGVLAAITGSASPATVFVTAFDQYAVRAFEVNALDYLLKPVAPARLKRAIERLGMPNDDDASRVVAARLDYHDRLFLRLDDRMGFVKVADIVSIASDGDYSVVRLASGRTHRARKSLREWLARLPENAFARVHRSTIVNLEYVERVEEWSHLSYRLYLRGASEPVAMSRRHAGKLKR